MTAINHSEDFANWFKNIGGNLISYDFRSIQTHVNFRPLQFSSLKLNPKRIKEQYNHKFKSNE